MKFDLKLPRRKAAAPAATAAEKREASSDREAAAGRALKGARSGGGFDRKRAMRVVAVLGVAFGAGQVMQALRHEPARQAPVKVSAALGQMAPVAVEPVSSPLAAPGAEAMSAAPRPGSLPLPTLVLATVAPLGLVTAPAPAPAQPEVPATIELAAADAEVPAEPASPDLATPEVIAATECPVTLDLAALPGGLVNVTLEAPCLPDARIVLAHQGLAVTGLTSDTGRLFATLPALVAEARIEARLPGGLPAVAANIHLPEVAEMRRFVVQWSGEDAFQLHAYLDGALFATAGHIRADNPGLAGGEGGYLLQLGDPAAPLPLLAEVFTWPLDPAAPVEVVVESEVTALTCNRELMAETLASTGTEVAVTDLTLAMPDCAGVGDFLVLAGLVPEVLTLAAARAD